MVATRDAARWILLTPVKPNRQDEFEDFIRDVIVPAVKQVRPHLIGMWQTLRPAEQGAQDELTMYGLLFYGDAPLSDWDLETLLVEAYGAEEGARLDREFEGFLAGEQQVHAFSGALPDG
jgi:hypothetical protein